MFLMAPISIILSVRYVLNSPNDINVIHNQSKISGSKNGAFCKDVPLEQLKKKAKEMKVTINDLVMAITSISLKEYMILKGDYKTNKIRMAVPFSLRDPVTNARKFKLENDFVPITVELDLTLKLEDALKLVKKRMNTLKNSFIPSG